MAKEIKIKADAKKIERALNFIRHGSYVKPAVIAAGLNYNTHLKRYQNGKKGLEPYKSEYYDRFEEAKHQAEVGYVETIYDSAIDGNIGASQWWLSRTRPQKWGKTERVEVKADNHQKIEFVPYSASKKNDEEDE